MRLLVFGAGTLISEILRSLPSFVGGEQLHITVATRDPGHAGWMIAVARAHAVALGREIAVEAVPHDWRSVLATTELIDAVRPNLVLHAASMQSAWSLTEPSRWSRFVGSHGYGVTLPLQLVLARHLQMAIGSSHCFPRWLNACFPDLVNACLSLTGPVPLCGIGNVALIAEHLRLHLHQTLRAPLRVIAAHSQLAAFQRERSAADALPLAWLGGDLISISQLASIPPLAASRELNAFNAAAASRLVWALLSDQQILTHAPGPDGLPGGYPIMVEGGAVQLDLPLGFTKEQAVAFNSACMAEDGAELLNGAVHFVPAAAADLADDAPELAAGFTPENVVGAAEAMLALRSLWIGQP